MFKVTFAPLRLCVENDTAEWLSSLCCLLFKNHAPNPQLPELASANLSDVKTLSCIFRSLPTKSVTEIT